LDWAADQAEHAIHDNNIERLKQPRTLKFLVALGDEAAVRASPTESRPVVAELHWNPPAVQSSLDTSLAWAVLNNQLEIADFLLQHGANINTRWASHEPASILHELVLHENYPGHACLLGVGLLILPSAC
jgi:hypothetical protein